MSEIGKYNNPKEVIEQWLLNPHTLGGEEMTLLNQWLTEFPWFGSLHTLKAVHAKEQGLSEYPHHLHRAAITTHDRGWLYEMVHSSHEPSVNSKIEYTPIEKTETAEAHPAPTSLTDWVDIFLEEELPNSAVVAPDEEEWGDWSISLENKEAAKTEITTNIEVDEKPSEVSSSGFQESTEISQPEEYPDSVDLAELGELGQDILNKAISSSIELEVSEKEIPMQEPQSPAPSTEKADYGDSFLNFIAASLGQPIEESESQGQKTEATPNSHKKEDVIERFIQTEPQINRGKAIEYVAGNMAKESLEEDLNLVTETMAKLYMKQGKLDKARKAYKKLIELYPEKSIYFATQLKNLNKKN